MHSSYYSSSVSSSGADSGLLRQMSMASAAPHSSTNSTVHQYTVQKRLLRAGELIREGVPVMKAAEQAGFEEYSTFLRAFQNTFRMSPREFR